MWALHVARFERNAAVHQHRAQQRSSNAAMSVLNQVYEISPDQAAEQTVVAAGCRRILRIARYDKALLLCAGSLSPLGNSLYTTHSMR